ncbi:MAG: DUF4954 family protein [Phycisphaeraceae bacterium]|nr:DUF4954 family protein [Phycisphaeraceae bacterium]
MSHLTLTEGLGDWIRLEHLVPGQDDETVRFEQAGKTNEQYRALTHEEIQRLETLGNAASDWAQVLVSDPFDTACVRQNQFRGLVRLGAIRKAVFEHHDMQVPTGITNSTVYACDVGDDVAIHNVHYLAHYIIGDQCMLLNLDEMHTTTHAKFGNGIVKHGEPEDVRVWMAVMNETGSRQIMPFEDMISADAFLWAKYRDDVRLQEALGKVTQSGFDSRRGTYGTVGDRCVIKNSRIIKDVKIGAHAYIKGANKLKNLTVKSSQEEPTQIGEGVELVNGIIGLGCHVFYGCKAIRFIMGNRSQLKYGARLLNSFLGSNSTVSCCEILNNLIFPAHEQHHNNSFLIAACVMGQSNLAAGATLGSNHNSRANDNEIQAGRGFWPGLCASLKHSCYFASFTLLSKADYPAELNIVLPFSLLNNNVSQDRLEVMPAYWWLYNMYALARNTWKFQHRDQRGIKCQNIEFDALAPDTVEEILAGRQLLALWIGRSLCRAQGIAPEGVTEETLSDMGHGAMAQSGQVVDALEVLGESMEKSRRKVVILKARQAYHAYTEMAHYYSVKNLLNYVETQHSISLTSMANELAEPRQTQWVNLGGQLVCEQDVDQLRADISSGLLGTWKAIHERYDQLWSAYGATKHRHAYATLCDLYGVARLDASQWDAALARGVEIQGVICERVYTSRQKDFDNPFRQATYRNQAEMTAALGTIDDDDFVKQVRLETDQFNRQIQDALRLARDDDILATAAHG